MFGYKAMSLFRMILIFLYFTVFATKRLKTAMMKQINLESFATKVGAH